MCRSYSQKNNGHNKQTTSKCFTHPTETSQPAQSITLIVATTGVKHRGQFGEGILNLLSPRPWETNFNTLPQSTSYMVGVTL